MPDEFTLALCPALREPVGLIARQLFDIFLVVVANIRPESTLVRRAPWLRLSEFLAFGMLPIFVGTVVPRVQNLECALVVLGNDEASVDICVVELVFIVKYIRIEGEGQRIDLGIDRPVIHDPFERDCEVVEDGVRVDEDARLVSFQEFGHHNGLLPGCSSVRELFNIDVVILVSMDLGCVVLAK